MAQPQAEKSKSPTPKLDGLTPLHLAVLQGSYARVRWNVQERVHGVNALTTDRITPLMLAALYGRSEIFLYLRGKKASPDLKDIDGKTALDYADPRSKFVQKILHQCSSIARQTPDTGRRRDIYRALQDLEASRRQIKKSYAEGRKDAQASAEPHPTHQTPASVDQIGQQQCTEDLSRRAVFLPSSDGKQLEFVEGRCVAAHERQNHRRKCIGVILAVDGNDIDMFAVSGWGMKRDGTIASTKTLDNTEFTKLLMRVAPILNYKLTSNRLDQASITENLALVVDLLTSFQHFPGTAAEKIGAFWACHAEKQLALFVLKKAVSRVCGTEEITESNLSLLRDQLSKLPHGLRETVIHLNHEIACRNCIRFLEVLDRKTGLIFQIQFHKWYIEGKRSKGHQLWVQQDGSVEQVTGSPEDLGANQNAELIDDELGLFDDEDDVATNLQCDSADHEGDTTMMHTDPATPRRPTSHLPRAKRQCSPGLDWREGSAVSQEPPYNSDRYPKLYVTPPSYNQGLPTPQSHVQFTGIPHVPTSPSPAPRSSGVGSGIQTASMSPSLSQEFEVEEILQAKEENGVQWYLVKWRGYPYDNNSWEPEGHLKKATDAVRKFWEELEVVESQTQDKAT